MGAELLESTCKRSEERHRGALPVGGDFEDSGENDKERSKGRSKNRSKDKIRNWKEEKDHRGRDQDRSKIRDGSKEKEKQLKDTEKGRLSSKEKRKDDWEDPEKDRPKGEDKGKDYDSDKYKRKDCHKDGKDLERKRDRENESEGNPEEMLQFKKHKKNKSLRKREKLDFDAFEAKARAGGLGSSDLGSRSHNKRLGAKEDGERADATRRTNAYQAAFAKADEASRALRMEQVVSIGKEEDAELFADETEDLRKSRKSKKISSKEAK